MKRYVHSHATCQERIMKHELSVSAAGCTLRLELRMAEHPAGVVVLVHGSGVTRHDALNRFVAARLVRAGFAALLVDLLEECEAHERHHVFDVETQAQRLVAVRDWLRTQPATRALGIGYFGTGVGAGIALAAAARAPEGVRAIVVRGGRPDTAPGLTQQVGAPTLYIAAEQGADGDWVRSAYRAAAAPKELVAISGAGDAFHESGAIEAVAEHACRWFLRHLAAGLEPRLRDYEARLKARHPGADCRVTLQDRPPHAHERKRFNVRLDVSFGERSFVVNREHDDDAAEALRAAFDAASAQLDALEAAKRAALTGINTSERGSASLCVRSATPSPLTRTG
jgi:pimeloyl-ACP methyl ester carboxylesterase